jgi:glycosyltransferase involved in cell wall biosynthesis/exo-beta-1,3-glucanase (GH17 family)
MADPAVRASDSPAALTSPRSLTHTPSALPLVGREPRVTSARTAERFRGKGRVSVDGKFFRCGGERFPLQGVTYGTFQPRLSDGLQYPTARAIRHDLGLMAETGFTSLRTYTTPPDDLLDEARDRGLRVLAGVYYPDWRYMLDGGRRAQRQMARDASANVRQVAARLVGREEVLGICIGNEVPADAVRWYGARRVQDLLSELSDVVHATDPDLLVTYANYPTTEYLDVEGIDFLTFNVYLERHSDLRRYLTRLHHLAGDRPLVLGELGHDAGTDGAGDDRQAAILDQQLATALERGVGGTFVFSWTDDWWVGGAPVTGWRFGLTRADRAPRPSLSVAAGWNHREVADVDFPWPSLTIAICAYNAASTLDECLRETCRLDYPRLEIVVVDDGSTDETAVIASRYDRVRLVRIPHSGLGAARNAAIHAATGDLIAYLDSDAYPTPEWPYYLALGLDAPDVGGVGGPNVAPLDDPIGARQVACAPGGPVHVLLTDDRAEHVPGCNMAFWRKVLIDAGGFDPIYTAAGDDVDVCWKVLDRGWKIAFHPAALVWHHRRSGWRAYLRQQRGYGKAETQVAARHPDRFTATGTARWRGRIYTSSAPSLRRAPVYRGLFGTAPFQSVYRGGGALTDLAHQIGVPAALLLAGAALLGAVIAPSTLWLGLPALLFIGCLAAHDAIVTRPPRGTKSSLRFRAGVATLHVLQPLARWWGRRRHRAEAMRTAPVIDVPPALTGAARGEVLMFDSDRGRDEIAAQLVASLRRSGVSVAPVTGWEDHDGQIRGSWLVGGQLLTSGHVAGSVLVRVRRRVRKTAIGLALLVLAVAASGREGLAMSIVALGTADLMWGAWRTGRFVRRKLGGDACSRTSG